MLQMLAAIQKHGKQKKLSYSSTISIPCSFTYVCTKLVYVIVYKASYSWGQIHQHFTVSVVKFYQNKCKITPPYLYFCGSFFHSFLKFFIWAKTF